jgi:hypothetical protein
MFVIAKNYTYRWDVKIPVPVSTDKFEDQSFTAIFRRLGLSEIEAITNSADANDRALAKAVLVGWENVSDEAGEIVTFTPDHVEQLLDVTGVASAVVRAFMDSINGQAAKVKN